jgi:D-alanyl-D-alanine carboxypeptidase/D-alanyl-D-alanine-endopeptidase (penicillin-binding protein 4)
MMVGVQGRLILGLLCCLILGGCGGGSGSATHPPLAGNAPPAFATGSHKPHRHAAVPDTPALRSLRTALGKALRQAGPNSGILVYDLGRQAVLYARRAGVGRPPASVEKLYTTVALLNELGPGDRLQTRVLGAGHLGAAGVWHGDLYLRGGGDPTFGDGRFNRVWELGYGPTAAQLAKAIRAAGIRRVTGRLIADESWFDTLRGGPQTGYAPDIPDFGGELSALTYDHGSTSKGLGPAAFAARQLARTLRSMKVDVKASSRPGRAPRHTRRIATVRSPPLSVLLKLMDVPSDDLFAELLTKQLGRQELQHGSIAAGAKVIARDVASYGLHPRIVDGSGLSRKDRSSPDQVVGLLSHVWHTPTGRLLAAALPVVGVSGTVRTVATRTAAQHHCVAKTGTLNYVTNLAGYCSSRGHQSLAFAIFIDGPENWRALVMLGHMVAAIARY